MALFASTCGNSAACTALLEQDGRLWLLVVDRAAYAST